MNLPVIERIWRVRGSIPLDANDTPAQVFDKLDPLFRTPGTQYSIEDDVLTYGNRNPGAQDKLATFTKGRLAVVERAGRHHLIYDLISPALLAVFLAPLLFLAFAQVTIALSQIEGSAKEARASEEAESETEDDEEDDKIQLNPLDIALGSPAAEEVAEGDSEEDSEKDEDESPHSPTTAYVLAGIFAALYVVGRILEPWLIRSAFRKRLAGTDSRAEIDAAAPGEPQPPG